MGASLLERSITTVAKAAFPDHHGSSSVRIGFNPLEGRLQTFRWEGVQSTPGIILGRLLWVGVALGIALIAALFFHRFDPAREKRKRARHVTTPSVVREAKAVVTPPRPVHLTPLVSGPMQFRFGPLLLAELRLMLKGLRWWWYMVAVGLIIASLSNPIVVARQRLLPAAWIWPLLIWSGMGTREVRHRTEQLVFSGTHPLRHQVPAIWLAGVIVALLAGSGVAVRLVLAGDLASMLAWMVGALFIPSLALALGCWSGNSKLFQVVYTLLWYIGPVNQMPALDFMGASTDCIAAGMPLIYLICTMVLFGLAVLGRRRQIQI